MSVQMKKMQRLVYEQVTIHTTHIHAVANINFELYIYSLLLE